MQNITEYTSILVCFAVVTNNFRSQRSIATEFYFSLTVPFGCRSVAAVLLLHVSSHSVAHAKAAVPILVTPLS